MNCLVTGGSGFIGTVLVDALVREGHDVRIYDVRSSSAFADLTVRGDVRDPDHLTETMQDVDIVFHLAAEHKDDVRPASLYREVNVDGARNLVLAAETCGVGRIVFTSTVAVYGLEAGEADETTPTEPFNDYGRSKLQAEHVLQEWAARDSTRTLAIIRPTVVFGENNRGNVFTLIDQVRRGRFVMVGDGSNRKSMCYVGNLVPFLCRFLAVDGTSIMNYVDKPDLTAGELIAMIRAELDIRGPLLRLPYWIGMAGGYAFDGLAIATRRRFPISRVRVRKFCASTQVSMQEPPGDFVPPFTLAQGISRMIESLG
jgi:nucleoside-diphosphate-sugar epimerase